jgi:hypothetical protein
MFIWKVEDMVLLNQKGGIFFGKEKIYNCESQVSREDKIVFVDSLHDGKLSYLLSLIDKFNEDKKSMPTTEFNNVKTVSLKAWIKKNDTKYAPAKLIDDNYHYGDYYFLGCTRNIQYQHKGGYDTYDDYVDEIFHRQLKECEKAEKKYFLEHDEYSILKQDLRDMSKKYRIAFSVSIGFCSDGSIFVYDENHDNKREITMDELKELLDKYEQLEKFIQKLADEINIKY